MWTGEIRVGAHEIDRAGREVDGGRVGAQELHIREVAVRLAVALRERGHRVHRLQGAR